MLNVGISEFLVFAVIALLVLGPDKLPEALRFVSRWYSKGKRFISNVQNDIDHELRVSELKDQMQKEMQRIAVLEQKMQTQMQELSDIQPKPSQTINPETTYIAVQQLQYGYRVSCPHFVQANKQTISTIYNEPELVPLKVAV